MTHRPAIIIGAGGHCRTVVSTLKACGIKIFGILDKAIADNDSVLSVSIIAERHTYLRYLETHDFYLAIGDNEERKYYFNSIRIKGGVLPKLIHPQAKIDRSSSIGEGSLISSSVIVCPEVTIGENVIVNTRALVEHNCFVGDHVHLAPDSSLAGKVNIGEGAFIGLKSSVNDDLHIGKWSRIGAGGVVIDSIPEYSTAVGNPAHIISIRETEEKNSPELATVMVQSSVKKTLELIDFYGRGCVIVVDNDQYAKGIVTDGLIRRYLLSNGDLNANVEEVMNKDFFYIKEKEQIKATQYFSDAINFIPILNEMKKLINIVHKNEDNVFNIKKPAEESRQIKDLYEWSKNKKENKYQMSSFIEKLENLISVQVDHVDTDLNTFLSRFTSYWCGINLSGSIYISEKVKKFYPELNFENYMEHNEEETTLKVVHNCEIGKTSLDENCLVLCGDLDIEISKEHNAYTVFTFRAEDQINAEGAVAVHYSGAGDAITKNFLSFIHPMQVASALGGFKNRDRKNLYYQSIINQIRSFIEIIDYDNLYDIGLLLRIDIKNDKNKTIDKLKHKGYKCSGGCEEGEIFLQPPWPKLQEPSVL